MTEASRHTMVLATVLAAGTLFRETRSTPRGKGEAPAATLSSWGRPNGDTGDEFVRIA